MEPFALKAYKEADRKAPLAFAFLMARDQLSDPVQGCLDLLRSNELPAPLWIGDKASAERALRFFQTAGPLSEEMMQGAYNTARPACFAQAKRVELYHFETPRAIICAKLSGRIFEWGWAQKSERSPVGKGAALDAEMAEELCDALCQLSLSMAFVFMDELEDRYLKRSQEVAQTGDLTKSFRMMSKFELDYVKTSAVELSPLREPLRAWLEALDLGAELASGDPKRALRM